MKKKLSISLYVVFFSILVIFFYLLITERDPNKIPSNLINKQAPSFQADSLISNKVFISTEVINQKTTLVNFFASWCSPCRKEHKYIKLLSKNENLKVIGINYKDNPDKAQNWLEKLGNPYSNIARDKNGRIAIDWGVYGIPETFIVNSNGVIKYKHIGPINKKIFKEITLLISDLE